MSKKVTKQELMEVLLDSLKALEAEEYALEGDIQRIITDIGEAGIPQDPECPWAKHQAIYCELRHKFARMLNLDSIIASIKELADLD